jgi:hypothetical protein
MKAQNILTKTFNSRDEYLAWRTEWRAIYAEVSEDIRTLRLVTKDGCRNPVISWDAKKQEWQRTRPWTDAEAKRQERAKSSIVNSQEAHRAGHKGLSALATVLMERRKWSKEEAQAQYLAAKANPPLVSIC